MPIADQHREQAWSHGLDISNNPIADPTACGLAVEVDPARSIRMKSFDVLNTRLRRERDCGRTETVFDTASCAVVESVGHMQIPIMTRIWPGCCLSEYKFCSDEVPGVRGPGSDYGTMRGA